MSEQPHRLVVLRLSLEGSVLAAVVALLLWGILTFGSQGVAAERHPLAALMAPAPTIAGSAAPQASPKGVATGDGSEECVEDRRCPPAKEWSHVTTSRQPGGGGTERAP